VLLIWGVEWAAVGGRAFREDCKAERGGRAKATCACFVEKQEVPLLIRSVLFPKNYYNISQQFKYKDISDQGSFKELAGPCMVGGLKLFE